jgi:hypothetical protein
MTTGESAREQTGSMLRGPLALAGAMVDACAEGATVYWSYWGPLGEPVIAVLELTAEVQRRYLAWLGDALDRYGPGRV